MSKSHDDDSQLIVDLLRTSAKSPRLVRSTVYTAPSDPTVQVRSWKMNEFKYYDVPSPFPTLARGLFSKEVDEGRYQIIARGYDKFFNIGEVPWTDWSCLEAHTGPDYTLSVKSNGCIIFIAAISFCKLIVTSKHALGGTDGVEETHSQAGHRWLKIHLASKEKTEQELANALWDKSWTAVAELCDDDFEEHVLPYPPEKSGLYLHGINENRKAFHTQPTRIVDAFAEEWGFLKTETIIRDTLAQVKQFTDDVAKTGTWKGGPVEGFVVRTNIVDPKPGSVSHDRRPPYPTGSSFFFKVKFDEPYMMYRDWREITKMLLSFESPSSPATIPNSKLKRKETLMYFNWVKEEIKRNPDAFEGYLQGKGIIATRERFLKWLDSEQGKTGLSELEPLHKEDKFEKTVIMPIAVPGCGKTSVAVALAHLFNFSHTQSDDVQGKKSGSTFVKNVVNLLRQGDIVIADKNNHLRQHRKALRDAISNFHPPVRLLALHWTLEEPPATIFRICGDRIYNRGDKHQSLQADRVGKSHEDVLWQFIRNREELGHGEADDSIEMRIDEPLEATVARAVDGCVRILGSKPPSQERIDEAVAIARVYSPTARKKVSDKTESKSKAPRYYAILAEANVEALVGPQLERAEDVPYDGKAFWATLVSQQRIVDRPHVTIVHKAELPQEQDLWMQCTALDQFASPPLFSFVLGHLVWNDRVMALTVDELELADDPTNEDDVDQSKHAFVSRLSVDVRAGLHITVGTRDSSVPPFEAKALVEAWREGRRNGIGSLELEGLSVKGRLRGSMS